MKTLKLRTIALLFVVLASAAMASAQNYIVPGNRYEHTNSDRYNHSDRYNRYDYKDRYNYSNKHDIDVKKIARDRTRTLDRMLRLSNRQEDRVYNIYKKYAKEMDKKLRYSSRRPDRREIDRIMRSQAPRLDRDILRVLDYRQQREYRYRMMR